jgi:hypothetical protein
MPGVPELRVLLKTLKEKKDAHASEADLEPLARIMEALHASFDRKQDPFDNAPPDLHWPHGVPSTAEACKLETDVKGIIKWKRGLVHMGGRIGAYRHAELGKRKALHTLLEEEAIAGYLTAAGLSLSSDTEQIIACLAKHAPFALQSLEQLRMLLPRFLAGGMHSHLESEHWPEVVAKLAPPGSGLHRIYASRPDEIRVCIVHAMKARRRADRKSAPHSVAPGVAAAAQSVSMSGRDPNYRFS